MYDVSFTDDEGVLFTTTDIDWGIEGSVPEMQSGKSETQEESSQ